MSLIKFVSIGAAWGVVALIGLYLINKIAPDPVAIAGHFYAQRAGLAPDEGAARSVFRAGTEKPLLVVSGGEFEGRELRLKFYREPERGGAELVRESDPVRIAAGKFYALELPDIVPGAYRVELLVNGSRARSLELKVKP